MFQRKVLKAGMKNFRITPIMLKLHMTALERLSVIKPNLYNQAQIFWPMCDRIRQVPLYWVRFTVGEIYFLWFAV